MKIVRVYVLVVNTNNTVTLTDLDLGTEPGDFNVNGDLVAPGVDAGNVCIGSTCKTSWPSTSSSGNTGRLNFHLCRSTSTPSHVGGEYWYALTLIVSIGFHSIQFFVQVSPIYRW